MKKNFYIFRHGESTYNVARRVQGHSDNSLLTERGKKQAAQTAKILQSKAIEIIISSPLKRSQQTAHIVAKKIKTPIIFDHRFIEVNVGVAEGLLYDEVLEKYGEIYKKWRSPDSYYSKICFENGENKQQVRQRVFDGLNHYAQNTEYKNIAVSAHGIILIQSLLALGIEENDIPNGSIIHLIYNDSSWNCQGFVKH